VQFQSATVYCSVACDVTLTQFGTAATATTLTPTPVNMSRPAVALAFSGSDSTGGKTLDKITIPAGGATVSLDLTELYLTSSANQNFSIGISSITGTTRITIRWTER